MPWQHASGQLNWFLSAGMRGDGATFQGRSGAVSHPQPAFSAGIAQTYRLLLTPVLSLVAMESDTQRAGRLCPCVSPFFFHRAKWNPGLNQGLFWKHFPPQKLKQTNTACVCRLWWLKDNEGRSFLSPGTSIFPWCKRTAIFPINLECLCISQCTDGSATRCECWTLQLCHSNK